MTLNREQLLTRNDRPVKTVKVGEEEIAIRVMSARELLAYEGQVKEAGDDRAKLLSVQLSNLLCDESGNRLLSVEDAMQLLDQSAEFVNAVISASAEANGLGDLKGN